MANHKWTTDNIPDQTGRIVVVTGSNSGIGFETAKALALKQAHITLAVRNLEKGEAAKTAIVNEFSAEKIEVSLLDLSSLESVKNFTRSFWGNHEKLDLLINNAGIMIPPYSKTEDGFESQMGTNHFGHFALTAQLFELIKQTPDSRIVNVSSNAHKMGKIDLNDLAWENRKYAAWKAYGDSKLANLYFTYELARKTQTAGHRVTITAAHPGLTDSNLAKGPVIRFFNGIFAQSGPMGALPTLMAATEPSAKSGDYFGPSGRSEWKGYPKKVLSNKLSHDEGIARKLWDVSEQLTGELFVV